MLGGGLTLNPFIIHIFHNRSRYYHCNLFGRTESGTDTNARILIRKKIYVSAALPAKTLPEELLKTKLVYNHPSGAKRNLKVCVCVGVIEREREIESSFCSEM